MKLNWVFFKKKAEEHVDRLKMVDFENDGFLNLLGFEKGRRKSWID
ncbi:hypothetical protein HanIR_Chr03g0138061 [Helianthus annuus]|nr:hypothetical protein HanIR_Chr03g0138061 [Helianthus annuus]